MMEDATARDFIESAQFIWYQRFALAPEVYTPGERDVDQLLQHCDIPRDLQGLSVLDIGATNGGVCFAMEHRGASRVVGVDIYSPDHFGFEQIRRFLGSNAEFRQASIYDLPTFLDEQFDIVFFLGVLYHLRHPLLALDNVRVLARARVCIETAVADAELGGQRDLAVARYYRQGELAGDPSNWFAPTVACVRDWCLPSGLEPAGGKAWPDEGPVRCLLNARRTPGGPE